MFKISNGAIEELMELARREGYVEIRDGVYLNERKNIEAEQEGWIEDDSAKNFDFSEAPFWITTDDDAEPMSIHDADDLTDEITFEDEQDALRWAAEKGLATAAEEALRAYVEDGGDVDDRIIGQQTALHLSARNGNANVVKVLLDAGADPNMIDDVERSPLHYAAKHGNGSVVELLLTHGADPNKADQDEWRPLHCAVANGIGRQDNEEAVQNLLAAGADPNLADSLGNTPTHTSVLFRRETAMEALLDAGADPDLFNTHGKTPLHLAAETIGGEHLVDMLVDHGASVELPTKQGQTVVSIAEENDCLTSKLVAAVDANELQKRTASILSGPQSGTQDAPSKAGLQESSATTNGQEAIVRPVQRVKARL